PGEVWSAGLKWQNPFAIGAQGDRGAAIWKFREYFLESAALLGELHELRGQTLLRHSGPADLPRRRAHNGLRGAEGARLRQRWPDVRRGRERRPYSPRGGGLARRGGRLSRWAATPARGIGAAISCALACSRVGADPFDGLEARVKTAPMEILGCERNFRRGGVANRPAASIDFELIGAVGARLEDPGAAVIGKHRAGAPLGWRGRLPRAPAATQRPGAIVDNFLEQEEVGMKVRTTYAHAKAEFGGRLRVASLGALEQREGEFQIVNDGARGVRVDAAIRVRDQEACPAARDLVAALDCGIGRQERAPGGEAGRRRCALFMLVLDISKAHRRVPVRREDWGLQARSNRRLGQFPGPRDPVWLNTAGTCGIGCASYSRRRLGALLHIILSCVVGPAGLLWALCFADDSIWLAGGAAVQRPLVLGLLLLFLRAFDVPIKRAKFRDGRRAECMDWVFLRPRGLAGVSDGRSRWAAEWCRRVAREREILMGHFREWFGRLGFVATLLLYMRPFWSPLCAWAAAAPADARVHVPPMTKWVLTWLAEAFEARVRIPFGRPVRHLGEKYRADTKAEGDLIVAGGWEVAGHEGPAGARWLSCRPARQ
ncbi:unnamed protein product, partial [Prorocentrum cordatum]